MPLRDLLLYIGSRQLSGMLQCEDGDDRKTVAIAAGVAVMASSTHTHERFSHMLVEKGYIGQDKLDLALEQAPKRPLGKTLVSQGYLTEIIVRDALVLKIGNTLSTLMDWSSGSWQFVQADASEAPAGVDAMVDLMDFWRVHGASLTHEALPPGWEAAAPPRPVKELPIAAEDTQFAPKFRREVKARLAARGRGKRFPKDLQARAVKHYWMRIGQGSFLSEVARELGLPPPTLRRWVLDAPASVDSKTMRAALGEGAPLPGGPALVGPNGVRVEIDLDTLADLLRRREGQGTS